MPTAGRIAYSARQLVAWMSRLLEESEKRATLSAKVGEQGAVPVVTHRRPAQQSGKAVLEVCGGDPHRRGVEFP